MAVSPQDLSKFSDASQMKYWEGIIDKELMGGHRNDIRVQIMFKEEDAETLANLYRQQGWTVSHRTSGGRSGGFIFDFSS